MRSLYLVEPARYLRLFPLEAGWPENADPGLLLHYLRRFDLPPDTIHIRPDHGIGNLLTCPARSSPLKPPYATLLPWQPGRRGGLWLPKAPFPQFAWRRRGSLQSKYLVLL